jgi:hypothetical protein
MKMKLLLCCLFTAFAVALILIKVVAQQQVNLHNVVSFSYIGY